MKTILNNNTDPFFNLALEEYLLKHLDLGDDVFYLWRNDPCVVIGRNQNPFNEIDLRYARQNDIPVLRRISGGGAVYHDLGNINFTFITTKLSERLNNYEHFLTPIIGILDKLELPVRFVAPTHLYLGDTKISGNAQSYHKNKMMHHGTLLYDVDMTHLTHILKSKARYATKAVDSTRAKTTNIKRALPIATDIDEFMEFLLHTMFVEDYQTHVYDLTDDDLVRIYNLAETKYDTWEWTFGESPEFTVRFIWDNQNHSILVTNGFIKHASLLPDTLIGERFDEPLLREKLANDALLAAIFQ